MPPPPHVVNDKPIDGAPAVLWHRTNGRLTKNDIAKTICDDKDNPIGIYTGVWTPDWAKGQEIRTYAAITDARDGDGDRLYQQSFNRYVAYLKNHPNGDKLLDRPSDASNVRYELAMRTRILTLKLGERTGQMIPPLVLLRGKEYPDDKVTHHNNMYNLRHTGDFSKADNGGNDSRFVTEAGSIHIREHWYVSSTESRGNRDDAHGTGFTLGTDDWLHKAHSGWSLRPFIAEIPQP